MNVYYPPSLSFLTSAEITVFLAGSIEMGAADDWQTDVVAFLSSFKDVNVLNPRRPDWDSSWKQSIDDNNFLAQVRWELTGLAAADVIVIYFDPKTKSPISLLELGLHAAGGKLIVCCPEGFWRKGNVDIVCDMYRVAMAKDLSELKQILSDRIEEMR